MGKKQRHNHPVLQVAIQGMHCASCEVLTEQRFKEIPGVESVEVSQPKGRALISYSRMPSLGQLQEALAGTEYKVLPQVQVAPERQPHRDYIGAAVAFGVVLALYFVLDWLKLVPKGLGIGETMSYGFIFLLGLVAAVSSCIAVTGGLLVAIGSRFSEAHPELQGWQKFRPVLHFNLGRVVGYMLLGGLVGAIGSAFTLSSRMTGVLSIAASLVMIVLGFQLLNIFPSIRGLVPKLPKGIAHKVQKASGTSDHPAAAFLLGSATFFLPCGFTQALQLYVLSKGSFEVGALTMLAFSLGTMPALLSLGALSSFLKGAAQRYFFRFAGATVVLLGLLAIGNGWALAGFSTLSAPTVQVTEPGDLQTAQQVDGKQVIEMEVVGYGYIPAHFKVLQGVPVEWHVDGTKTSGCATILQAPDLGITAALPSTEEKVIAFTPDKVGTFAISCPMGMTTRGASIEVVANTAIPTVSLPAATSQTTGEIQSFTLTYTNDKGFAPRQFTAKKDQPVELTVDIRGALSGCMSTLVGSDYGIVSRLKPGENKVRFTPTKAGTLKLTCPMGIPMAQFLITD